jgi:PIN domain nuclease of toxin-antitoxin system
MRLLLDTCAFLWLTQEPDRLSKVARAAVDDESNQLLFSHASIWELYLKQQAGKMKLPTKPDRWIREQLAEWVTTDLPIDLASLSETLRLPNLHRDPFDRLLVAQAIVHELTLLTPDPWIQKYRVNWHW